MANTESVVMLVRALVGVGGDVKLTMSGVVMTLFARVTVPSCKSTSVDRTVSSNRNGPIGHDFPENDEDAPVLTAPFTCQNTLEAWAPLVKTIVLEAAGVSAPFTWKTNTALGSPWPFNVMVAVSAKAPEVVDAWKECLPGLVPAVVRVEVRLAAEL